MLKSFLLASPDDLQKGRWNLKQFFFLHLACLLLVSSWLFPQTRPFWDTIDLSSFHFLNRFIQKSSFWQNFWAIANHNYMDWFHDIVMFAFFFVYIKKAAPKKRLRRVSEFIFAILFCAFIISFINKFFIPDILKITRNSPTMAFEEAVRLSDKVSWLPIKDHSKASFPGDHGTTALMFTAFTFLFMNWRVGILASLYAIFFCLPRLVLGAHWLTDDLIGSGAITLLAISWAFGSPIRIWAVNFIEFILYKFKLTYHLLIKPRELPS